jgi:hypothetical protein
MNKQEKRIIELKEDTINALWIAIYMLIIGFALGIILGRTL